MNQEIILDSKQNIFEYIYRIQTASLLLDLNSNEDIPINSKIKYTFKKPEPNDTDKNMNIMYGVVYNKSEDKIYASFGGLLGEFKGLSLNIGDSIDFFYQIEN